MSSLSMKSEWPLKNQSAFTSDSTMQESHLNILTVRIKQSNNILKIKIIKFPH